MLEQILQHLNNWFLVDIHEGKFSVENGSITLPFLQTNQYFRIIGSVFNDGLYQYPATDLTDETFTGAIWALAVPDSVIALSEEMSAWQSKNGEMGLYQSESFGGYSYSIATNKNGGALTVFDVFASRLASYKKVRVVGYVRPTRRSFPVYKRPFNPDYPWR